MTTSSETPSAIDHEGLFHEDEQVVLATAEALIDDGVRAAVDSSLYPRGAPTDACASRLPEGLAERIEESVLHRGTTVRRKVLMIFWYQGGEKEADITRRLILQTLGQSGAIDDDAIGDTEYALMALGHIGGREAFQLLLSLREHPNKHIANMAQLQAIELYTQHLPREGSDWGMAEHYADEEADRLAEFNRLYPKPQKA